MTQEQLENFEKTTLIPAEHTKGTPCVAKVYKRKVSLETATSPKPRLRFAGDQDKRIQINHWHATQELLRLSCEDLFWDEMTQKFDRLPYYRADKKKLICNLKNCDHTSQRIDGMHKHFSSKHQQFLPQFLELWHLRDTQIWSDKTLKTKAEKYMVKPEPTQVEEN